MNLPAVLARRAELQAHPGFRHAVHAHTDGILRVRHDLRHVCKMLAKEERYRAFTIFVMLAAKADLDGRRTVAYRDFYETCTEAAGISDRTAKTVASLLVHFRFALSAQDGDDRRRRSLVPTGRTLDYCQYWGRPAYDALALAGRPFGAGDLRVEMQATFASALPDYCAAGLAFFTGDADFERVFAAIEGGSLVCMSALSAAMNETAAPSRSEIAELFGISRAQVSRVIAEGRAAGLFTPDAKVTPSRRLNQLYLECEATVLAFIDVHREHGRRYAGAQAGRARAD